VILMRRRLLEEAKVVAAGGEPKGLIRDPEQNHCVRLPIIDRERFTVGYSMEDVKEGRVPPTIYPQSFIFQAGQPQEITWAYRAAMGMDRLPQPVRADGPLR
jgi:5,5'-dehydrodivanillate O-demethylase oxygenase subunit